MGLPHGCTNEGDEYFAKKYSYNMDKELSRGIMNFYAKDVYPAFDISGMLGDCTACTLHSYYAHTPELFDKLIPVVQEYMSMNARISCFFSKKIEDTDIDAWMAVLKKHNILGKHVQKSNREPGSNMYMLSGIIKVVNPFINTYDSFKHRHIESFEKHNSNNPVKYNERAAMHKLYQFKE